MADLRPRTLARQVWWLVVLEKNLYVSLARWLVRRPDRGGPGATPYGYARMVTPMMGLWIFASAAEVPLIHVLVPWEGIRLTLLVLGVWGLVWMIGFLASLHVYPHLVTDEGIRIRNSALVDLVVPWDVVATAGMHDHDFPSTIRTLQVVESDEGVEAAVTVSGRVNVTLELRAPFALATREGERLVDRISLWVDEPRDLVSRVRRRSVTSP
ncbi:hypothetical protein [Mumia sp. DW29H23]|uniref:hypothetical protein n=1 Tax=Mumia sp. DW29H23 TaxID=3421241 RepID=UPI003D68BBF9